MRLIFLILFLSVVYTACAARGTTRVPENGKPSYVQIATQKFGDPIYYRFNSSRTFVLCVHQKKETNQLVHPPFAFFVYELASDSVLYEDSFHAGRVDWLNDNQIKIALIPGVISGLAEIDEKSGGFIYDVRLRKRLYEKKIER